MTEKQIQTEKNQNLRRWVGRVQVGRDFIEHGLGQKIEVSDAVAEKLLHDAALALEHFAGLSRVRGYRKGA